jgi:catechol 2,3-dioxygenase-like lactoylglutathione lyase family enzyme
MLRGIDHIVIAVRDLAAASADYASLGFTVTPGGEHTGGATHNALISFADGSYFELIAFREPDRPQDHKWWERFAKGEGTVDFALLADDVANEAARLTAAGIAVEGPVDGGRQRPDGQLIAWRSLALSAAAAPLPFVIEDVTPRELRVPPAPATEHPLGVTGVAGLTLLVTDLDRAAEFFAALLGTSGEAAPFDVPGVLRAYRFNTDTYWLALAEPDPNAADLQRHIAERGPAPYEIVLGTERDVVDPLPINTAHGARIRFEQR